MNDAGDGMSADFGSADQRAAFEADRRACEQSIGTPPPPEPLTVAEIQAQYRHLVEMRGCLLRLGHATSTPPPEEEFIEVWQASQVEPGEDGRIVQEAPWTPFADIPGRAVDEVDDTCPQAAPSE